jgi:hypothetical protein
MVNVPLRVRPTTLTRKSHRWLREGEDGGFEEFGWVKRRGHEENDWRKCYES